MTERRVEAGPRGRLVIAVIGIDRYHHWRRLGNAVSDATGAAALFERLGFALIVPPLLDEAATGQALQSLVTDDLKALGPDDSLVLFYAGHGGTRRHPLGDRVVKTGYLIPVDASDSPDKVSTWIDLEGWLRAVALLPARHILVVLDACHSGIALDPILKWRDIGTWQDEPLGALQTRRSRRIITSALDDQLTLDSGPVHGHSLFTGCLIEALTEGLRRGGRQLTTGSEVGVYVQRRVETYPESRQTPDFGTFAFDDRGEMVIPLVAGATVPHEVTASSTSGALVAHAARVAGIAGRAAVDRAAQAAGAASPSRSAAEHLRRDLPPPAIAGGAAIPKAHSPIDALLRRWWGHAAAFLAVGGLEGAWVVQGFDLPWGVLIVALSLAVLVALGRLVPDVPSPLRWFSAVMLRRPSRTGLVLVAICAGAVVGWMARGPLDRTCRDELAAVDAAKQSNPDRVGQALAEAAKACELTRRDEAHHLMDLAREGTEREAPQRESMHKPDAPVAPADAGVGADVGANVGANVGNEGR